LYITFDNIKERNNNYHQNVDLMKQQFKSLCVFLKILVSSITRCVGSVTSAFLTMLVQSWHF